MLWPKKVPLPFWNTTKRETAGIRSTASSKLTMQPSTRPTPTQTLIGAQDLSQHPEQETRLGLGRGTPFRRRERSPRRLHGRLRRALRKRAEGLAFCPCRLALQSALSFFGRELRDGRRGGHALPCELERPLEVPPCRLGCGNRGRAFVSVLGMTVARSIELHRPCQEFSSPGNAKKRPGEPVFYGAKEIRTPDPNAASVVLYQTEL